MGHVRPFRSAQRRIITLFLVFALFSLLVSTLFLLSSCGACSHQWEASTCEVPQRCAKCGATEGEPLGHAWKAATCTSAKKCERCSKTEGAPLGHEWEEATCYSARLCSRCGLTSGTSLEHDLHDGVCANCGFDIHGTWFYSTGSLVWYLYVNSKLQIISTFNGKINESVSTSSYSIRNTSYGLDLSPVSNWSDFYNCSLTDSFGNLPVIISSSSVITVNGRTFKRLQ